jgi:hypothetical protein
MTARLKIPSIFRTTGSPNFIRRMCRQGTIFDHAAAARITTAVDGIVPRLFMGRSRISDASIVVGINGGPLVGRYCLRLTSRLEGPRRMVLQPEPAFISNILGDWEIQCRRLCFFQIM